MWTAPMLSCGWPTKTDRWASLLNFPTFFHTLSQNNHIQVSVGIFEEMFSGYGAEYLWNKNDSPLSNSPEFLNNECVDEKGDI